MDKSKKSYNSTQAKEKKICYVEENFPEGVHFVGDYLAAYCRLTKKNKKKKKKKKTCIPRANN